MSERRVLALAAALLAPLLATASLLGPLGADRLVHRTSETTLNQLMGSDLAALLVARPSRGGHRGRAPSRRRLDSPGASRRTGRLDGLDPTHRSESSAAGPES